MTASGGGGGDRDARVVLSADVSNYQQQMASAAQSTQRYASSLDHANERQQSLFQSARSGLDKFGKSILSFQTGMVAITATLEKQMSTIEGVFNSRKSGFSNASTQIGEVRKSIKQLSTELPVARGELAQLATSITKMGVTSGQSIAGLTRNFSMLAAATGEDPQALASGMVGLSRQMGTLTNNMSPATQIKTNQQMNASLNNLSANAGVPAQSVLDFSQSIAPTAKTAGMSQQATMGASTAFIAGGAEGGYAATAFTGMLNQIMNMRSVNSDEMNKYSNALGIPRKKLDEMSPFEIAQAVLEKVGSAGSSGVATANNLGFEGVRTVKAMQAVNAAGGTGKYVNMALTGEDTIPQGMEAATGGLIDELDLMKNKFTDIGDTLGSGLLPVFRTLAEVTNALVTPLTGFAHALGPALSLLSAVSIGGAKLLSMVAWGGTAAMALATLRSPFGQGFGAGRRREVGPATGRMNAIGRAIGRTVSYVPGLGPRGGPAGPVNRLLGYGMGVAQTAGRFVQRNVTDFQNRASGGGFMWGLRAAMGHQQPIRQNAPAPPRRTFGQWRTDTQANMAAAGTNAALISRASATAARGLLGVATSSVRASASLTALGAGMITGGIARGAGRMASGLRGLMAPLIPMAVIGGAIAGVGKAKGYLDDSHKAMTAKAGELTSMETIDIQTKYNAALGVSTNALAAFTKSVDSANPAVDQKDMAKSLKDESVKTAGKTNKDYTDPLVGTLRNSAEALQYVMAQPKMDSNTAVKVFQDLYKNENISDQEVENIKKIFLKNQENVSQGVERLLGSGSLMQAASDQAQGLRSGQSMLNRPGGVMSVPMQSMGDNKLLGQIWEFFGGDKNTIRDWATTQQAGAMASDPTVQGYVGVEAAAVHKNAYEASQTTDTHAIGKNKGGEYLQANTYGKLVATKGFSEKLGGLATKFHAAQKAGNSSEAGSYKALMKILIDDAAKKGVEFDPALMDKLTASDNQYNDDLGNTQTSWESGVEASGIKAEAASFGMDTMPGLAVKAAKMTPLKLRASLRDSFEVLRVSQDIVKTVTDDPLIQKVLEGTEKSTYGITMASERIKAKNFSYEDLMVASRSGGDGGVLLEDLANQQLAKQRSFSPTLSLAGQQNLNFEESRGKLAAIKADTTGNSAKLIPEVASSAREGLIQLVSSMQQFAIGRKREQEAWQISVSDSQEDFNKQMKWGEEDYQRSVMYSEQDFYRNRERSNKTFQISMKRSREDYLRQEKYMFEDSAKSIYDVYSRVQAKHTASADTIIENLRDQNARIAKQRDQLDQAKQLGFTQQTIDTLGLTDPENQQQLDEFIQDAIKNPAVIKKINAEVAKRGAATKDLLDNPDNTPLRRQREEHARNIRNQLEDYKRGMTWGLDDFKRQMLRGNEAYNLQLQRALNGYEVSMARAERSRQIQLQQGMDDFMGNWKLAMADEETLMKEGYKIAGEYFGTYSNQMISFITQYRDILAEARGYSLPDTPHKDKPGAKRASPPKPEAHPPSHIVSSRTRTMGETVNWAEKWIDSMKRQGKGTEEVTEKARAFNGILYKQALQIFGNDKAARAFVKSIGLIPRARKTEVKLLGANTAAAGLAAVAKKQKGIDPKVKSTVSVSTGAAVAGLNAVIERLKRIKAMQAVGGAVGAGIMRVRRSEGGLITGPGTSTSDSIPVAASNGEYMVKAAAVDKYGIQFMDAINKGEVAQRSSGGYIDAAAADRRRNQLRSFNDDRISIDWLASPAHPGGWRGGRGGYDSRNVNVANKGITGEYAKQVTNNYNNTTNFSGDITIKSNSPTDMAKQLQQMKRSRSMRGLPDIGA